MSEETYSSARDAAAASPDLPRSADGTAGPRISIPAWAMSLALFSALYLIYAPSFTMDFLTLDELGQLGKDVGWKEYSYYALAHGRPLCFLRPLVYAFVGRDPEKIQLVRFVSFLVVATLGIVLSRFLTRESGRPVFAFLTTLFLLAQLPFQLLSGFSLDLISFFPQPTFLSLAAFGLHFYFFPKRGVRSWKAKVLVFVLLLAALQSGQTWAFFAMVPLSYLVLAGNRERVGQARDFLVLAFLALVISTVSYGVGLNILHAAGEAGHARGEQTLEAVTSSPLTFGLRSLDPQRYWPAFKLWTYPFPFHNQPANAELRETLAHAVMFLWLGLIGAAIATELRVTTDHKRWIAAKWLCSAVCLGFGALVLLADAPVEPRESRPHLTLVMSGVCIFIGAHALSVLSSRYPYLRTKSARAVAIATVLMTAFGAQSGLLRGYVDTRGDQLDFIRTELAAKPPTGYDRIVVVLPPRRPTCISEPCDPFYSGQVTHRVWQARRPERYRYVLETLNIPAADKQIEFVERRPRLGDRDLLIDWRKYHRAREAYALILRGPGPD